MSIKFLNKILLPLFAIVTVGIFLTLKKDPETTIVKDPSYNYSLKLNNRELSSYRSPASKKLEEKKQKQSAKQNSINSNNSNNESLDSFADEDTYSEDSKPSKLKPSNSFSQLPQSQGSYSANDLSYESSSSNSVSTPGSSYTEASKATSKTDGPTYLGAPTEESASSNGSSSTTTSSSSSSSSFSGDTTPPALSNPPMIKGKIISDSPLVFNKNYELIQSAYAASSCVDPRILLVDLKNYSVLMDNPISEQEIDSSTAFSFDPLTLSLDLNTPSRYMLQTLGCEVNFQRIITSFYADQDLGPVTTLISKVLNTKVVTNLESVNPEAIQDIYNKVGSEAKNESNLETIYGVIESNTSINQSFSSAFSGSNANQLESAAPDINNIQYQVKLKEKDTFIYNVNAYHWNTSYTIGYEWRVDGVVKSNSKTWTYIPRANSKRTEIVTLIVGKKNSSDDNVDTTNFPYHELNFDTEIENVLNPIAPMIALGGFSTNPSSTRNITLTFNTGNSIGGDYFENCETFDKMAITENNETPADADFIYSCLNGPNDNINYTIQEPSEGTVTLKLWTKDLAEAVSETPSELPVFIDTSAPVLAFSNLLSSYRADETFTIAWTATESNSSSASTFQVEFYNGSSWSTIANINSLDGELNNTTFSTDFLFPNQNIIGAKFKVTFSDTLGQSTILESNAFAVERPILGISPSTLSMGNVANNSTSSDFTITVSNTGNVSTKNCTTSITGTNAAEFNFASNSCDSSQVSANGTCTVDINATPTDKGVRTATFNLVCGLDTISANIDLTATNNSPTNAADQNFATNEDTNTSFTVSAFTDSDGDPLTYEIVGTTSNGVLSNCLQSNTDLICDYAPNPNYFGQDSFTYRAYDGNAYSAVSTVTIDVNAVNDAPTLAASQSVSTSEDTPLTFALTTGADIEGSPLTYIKVSDTADGTISCVGGTSNSCTYTPNPNFNGTDSFTYKVNDGSLDSTIATVTITISPVNDAPVMPADQTASTNEDNAVNFTLSNATDIDIPAQALSYKIITAPTNGVLSNCITTGAYGSDLTCTYSPNSNFNGTDSFTYIANDTVTDAASVATMTITINAVNDAPTLIATQTVSTNEDTLVNFSLNAGTDVEGDSLTYIIESNPVTGTLNCTGGTSTSCSYMPGTNETASVTFTYKVFDGALNSNTATVTINITAENDPPVVGANQNLSTPEDTALNFTINSGSDVDLPAQTLSYKVVTAPTHGTLTNCITTGSYSTDLTCTYTPSANYNGSDSFTYRVNDGLADSSAVASVSFTITAVNDIPTVAATQSVSTDEDVALNFSLNAGSDIEGSTLSYIIVSNPTNGALSCTGGTSRACTYSPNANYNGSDSFTYKVNDGTADSSVATVTVTINPTNDAPTLGANQTLATNEDTALNFTINSGADIDLPAQTLSYKVVSGPTKGVLSNCISTGSYSTDLTCTYTPNPNLNGSDSFTYLVNDGLVDSVAVATVTINITAVNDAPTLASTQSVSTNEDTPVTFDLQAGSDIESDPLTYIKVTNTANGTISCTGGSNRSCTYTPNPDFNGSNSFTYKVNDGALDSSIATVAITVTPVNDRPVMGANQSFTTDDITPINFTINNATDIDSGSLSYKIVTAPTHGAISNCITTGSYGTDLTCTFTPTLNYNGSDSFTYIANDGSLDAAAVATISFTINDKTPAPAPAIALSSAVYTNSTAITFTASSCTDTPFLLVNESSAPLAGDSGWQACSTSANAITYTTSTSQGSHTLKVWSKDTYGNVSTTSTNASIVYDTVAPTFALTTPPPVRGGQTYSLAWTATELNTTTSLNFTVDFYNGSAWSTIGTTASTTGPLSNTAFTKSWTVPSLNISNAKFRVSFTDRAGNSNTVTSADFTIDSIAPALAISSPANNSYHRSSATLTGTCETGLNITFSGDIQATFNIACSGGSFNQLVNFSDNDGTKTINLSQTDAAGNITTVSRDLIRDEVAPVMTKTGGISPDFTKNNTPNAWSGVCEGNYTISVSGSQTTTFNCTSGSWSWTPSSKTVDGVYSYDLVQTDAAGNTSAPPLTLSWERDATPPVFAVTAPFALSSGGTKNLLNNASSVSLTGSCEGTNTIQVTGDATNTFSCSSSSWTWNSPTFTTDATRSFVFNQTDSAGNISTLTLNWTRDTTGPALTIAKTLVKSNTDTETFTGNCEDGLTITVSGTQSTTTTCTSGAWSFTTASNTTDATRTYSFAQTNATSNTTTVSVDWIRETNVPTVSSFSTTAPDPTTSSFIPVNLSATSANSEVNISHMCIKSNNSTKPLSDDGCFIAVNSPSVGQALSPSLSLTNYSYLLGWSPITYNVFVWVMDEAKNISDLSAAGTGTDGTDTLSRTYDPGQPPTIWDVVAGNDPNMTNPPTRAQSSVPAGSDVYVRWKTSDNTAIPTNGITLYYTADEISFTEIVSGLSLANHGCTGYSLQADEGCYKWTGGSPLNTSYKIRVKVTDADGTSTQLVSNPMNSDTIKIIAGNTESGLGGSAQTALFFTRKNGSEADPHSLVVTNNGRFFVADYKRGILTIDPTDGKQKVFIPTTGTSSGDGGPAESATLRYPTKIALDYQGRLLIMDTNRIRRVDLNQSTPTIETIIGGGSDTGDTVANPLDVSIYTHSSNSWTTRGMVFFATPNGDIYFHSDYALKDYNKTFYRIRIYKASTGQVISKYFTGNGDNYDATTDLMKCRLHNPGLRFDISTSELTGVRTNNYRHYNYPDCDSDNNPATTSGDRYVVSYYDPATFAAISAYDGHMSYYISFVATGMDGNVYAFGDRSYLNRINFDGTVTRILGSGTRGVCADGTNATSCNMDLQDFFISTSGKIYMLEGGQIRTVDENGQVVTLFGQRRSYGDGVNALNARFDNINTINRLDNGKILVGDSASYYIKEFEIEGNVSVVAGDGNYKSYPSTSVDVKQQGFYDGSWWVANKANGDIYLREYAYGQIHRLNRATNLYERVVGCGATDYWNADGMTGNSKKCNGNQSYALPIGFDGTNLLTANMKYNGTELHWEDFMLKLYDSTDSYRQSHVAGSNGSDTYDGGYGGICTTGSTAASCKMPYYSYYGLVHWDAANNRWIFNRNRDSTSQGREIWTVTQGGTVDKIAYLARRALSYHYMKVGATEYLYYCHDNGRIYQHNITTDSDMGALNWQISNLNCKGLSLEYNPTNNSLLFPFEQNGLFGVAEYFLP